MDLCLSYKKRNDLCLLTEVLLKVLLKVEVGKFLFGRISTQKLLKLGVRLDDSSVTLLLKVVGLDVLVD